VRLLQYLIYACFVIITVGGTGMIAGLVAHSKRAQLPFMLVLTIGLGLFGLTLVVALVGGVYLYFFTDRKSLDYFKRP